MNTNNIRRYLLLLAALFPIALKAQSVEKLIDTACLKKIYARFDSFVESVDSLRERKESLNVYVIYHTHLKDNDIEESRITPKYYLSGGIS
ncbi:MAG: hypothetical protein IJ057_09875 [Bacteroidales bacterium]|nr:hypothetical protein [Bacteroidales bacterium]